MDKWLATGFLSKKRKTDIDELNKNMNTPVISLEDGASQSTSISTLNRKKQETPEPEEEILSEDSVNISTITEIVWPSVWTASQCTEFKNKYFWLMSLNGKLGCKFCAYVKNLGPSKRERLRISEEWSKYLIEASGKDRATKLSNLRMKIKKHIDTEGHKLAEKIYNEGQEGHIEECINTLTVAEEDITAKVFRTAYYVAKKNRPFSDHEDLIKLQQINGVNLGSTLHSRFTATNIITHIAHTMREQLISHIVSLNSKISVLIDESTSLSNKTTLVIYLKANLANDNYNYCEYMFLDLCELESQDSATIVNKLLETLKICGLHENYLKENWIAIATDGASVMIGKHSGVVTRLRQKYQNLFSWHCLNHRLELSVNDAIKDVSGVNHFKLFLNKLYSLYSQSPKNSRALENASHELGLRFLKIGRVLGVRWVASSFRTVKAVWSSYEALYSHFNISSEDSSSKDTFIGLKRKLESPEFVLNLGLMFDILQELSILSTELQSRTTTLPRAEHLIKRTIRIIESFKENAGEKYLLSLESKEKMIFQNVRLSSNNRIVLINKNQFIQSITDRMKSRLCSIYDTENDQLLKDISVLDPEKLKTGYLNLRYGEEEIKRICRRFKLDEIQAIQGLRDFKENVKDIPKNFKPFLATISALPCSTAECERGFSLMNNIVTDLRASLLISNVSNLMFINTNGPPIEQFQPVKYIKSWLLKHRSATDTRSKICSGKSKKENDNEFSRQALWNVFL